MPLPLRPSRARGRAQWPSVYLVRFNSGELPLSNNAQVRPPSPGAPARRARKFKRMLLSYEDRTRRFRET